MTGFESKRQAAQAKLDDDDDTQVYADTLLIVYQRGFADGKRAALAQLEKTFFCVNCNKTVTQGCFASTCRPHWGEQP